MQRISFDYDSANRRTRIVYANGIKRRNSYDANGQLTAITYINPDGSLLGDLNRTDLGITLRNMAYGSLSPQRDIFR